MAKGFKHGVGGESVGGEELVIVNGTTRPVKATQNAIWVKTNVDITSYVISATQPSAPTEGLLWLSIADTGKVKMSAPVGKDWITVYPLTAKLCVSGSWVDVEARSYQYGEWVALVDMNVLYEKGIINYALGGGLEVYSIREGNYVTFGEETIIVDNTWGNACVGTKEKVDLSKYTKMVIVIDSASTANGFVLSVVSQKTDVSHADMVAGALAHVIISGTGTYELNVANCGNAYVLFGAVESADQKMVVSKWYFE